jgi:hypothetical protein
MLLILFPGMPNRIFLLSPANSGGERARLLFRERATFELVHRLRQPPGAPLGEVFAFVSGLYFRGKLTYALRFARPPEGVPGVLVITPSAGLRSPAEAVTLATLRSYARVPIDARDQRYRRPLVRDARLIDRVGGGDLEVVLLGSIATGKYVDVLLRIFGERLLFPGDFVGRGDMSRGGLLLRSARSGMELTYTPVSGAVRHGPRPPRLPKLRGTAREAAR